MNIKEALEAANVLKAGADLTWIGRASETEPFISKMLEALYMKTGADVFSGRYVYAKEGFPETLFTGMHIPEVTDTFFWNWYSKPEDLDVFFRTERYKWEIETFYFASELCLSGCPLPSARQNEVLSELMYNCYGPDEGQWYVQGICECAAYLCHFINGEEEQVKSCGKIRYSPYLSIKEYMDAVLRRIWMDAGRPPEDFFRKVLPELMSFFFHFAFINKLDDEDTAGGEPLDCMIVSGKTLAVYQQYHGTVTDGITDAMDAAVYVLEHPVCAKSRMYRQGDFQLVIYYDSYFNEADIHPLFRLAVNVFNTLYPEWEALSGIPDISA